MQNLPSADFPIRRALPPRPEPGLVRGPTIKVAASNASREEKVHADITCSGKNDGSYVSRQLAFAPSNGYLLQFSPGTFDWDAGVTFTTGGIHVRGAGMGYARGTDIRCADGVHAFTLDGQTTNCWRNSIRDLQIRFNWPTSDANQQTSGTAIRMLGAQVWNINLSNLAIWSMYNGISLNVGASGFTPAGAGWVDGCVIGECKNRGISITGAADFHVSRSYTTNLTTQPITYGLYADRVSGLYLVDFDCHAPGYGIALVSDSAANTITHVYGVRVYLDQCGNDGLYGLVSHASGNFTNVNFATLTVSKAGRSGVSSPPAESASYGLRIDKSAGSLVGVHFTDLNIEGCAESGGYLANIEELEISGGRINNNRHKASAGIYNECGLYIVNCPNYRLSGLRVGDKDSAGLSYSGEAHGQKWGIYDNGGGGDDIIANCDVTDQYTAGGAGIYLADGSKVRVSGCPGYNPRGALGPPAVPASTVAYTNAYGVDCTVHVTGGTVTVIAVGGTTTGLTSGSFRVPNGGTITITYSVVPTWVFLGD